MIPGLEIPQGTFEFHRKGAVLAKLIERAETVEAANQERLDLYVEFLRIVTKDLKISVGSKCKYIKEATSAKSDLEFISSGQPKLPAYTISRFDTKMPGRLERLEWKCMPLELSEWFIGWRMWHYAACNAQDQERQLIYIIRM